MIAEGQTRKEVKIQKSKFQGDMLSALLIVTAIMPLNYELEIFMIFGFSKPLENIDYLMYKNDIKVFARNKKEMETPIHPIKIYSQNIEKEVGIEKYALLVMKRGKRERAERIEMPNQENI